VAKEHVGAGITIRWPNRKRGPLEIAISWHDVEGRWEPTGTEIRSLDGTPLTAVRLRLPWAQIWDAARPGPMRTGTSYIEPESGKEVSSWSELYGFAQPKRGRPPKYGPEHFAKVAQVYSEAHANRRTPTRAVAKHFKATESQAAKWVARCRELGLLPKTTRGKARIVPERKGKKR
jgi:hypothetical protein